MNRRQPIDFTLVELLMVINESIDPAIYGMLMTSNRVTSKSRDRSTGAHDRKFARPTGGSY